MNESYKSLNDFYREKFGKKIFKVSLDAGFSCPNKDGTKGVNGCTFCNGSVAIGDRKKSLKEQFEEVKKRLHAKWPSAGYIPFLEANTNTYASLETLKSIYEPLLILGGVVGLSIATRCDAITPEIYEYLSDLNERTYLTIELGLQSAHDETLRMINRGHTVDEFTECVRNLRRRKINVVVHIIDGFPWETPEMMIETIRYINRLDVQGIKFHMLFIEKGTTLAEMYEANPFPLLTRDEYIRILAEQIEVLDEKIVVHRLISGPDNRKLLAPTWLLGKFTNLNAITKYFKEHAIHQGTKK